METSSYQQRSTQTDPRAKSDGGCLYQLSGADPGGGGGGFTPLPAAMK